jgi:hypothetical protein
LTIDTVSSTNSEVGVSVPNLPGFYELEMTVVSNENTLETSFPVVYVRGPLMPSSFTM